jgi:hypothetical protein
VKNLSTGSFVLESALFVYNKWDQVESDKNVKKASEFKQYITSQLTKYWPNLDPSAQVVEFSTHNAALVQDKMYISEKFVKFMNLLKSMLLQTISAKLKAEWRLVYMFYTIYAYQRKGDPKFHIQCTFSVLDTYVTDS